jgi:hypothetical protein
LFLPGLIYDQDYDPADMVCGESNGDVPEPWCKSNPFDVWWQSVLHVEKGAKGVAMFSHVLNFAIAPLFVAAVICRIVSVGGPAANNNKSNTSTGTGDSDISRALEIAETGPDTASSSGDSTSSMASCCCSSDQVKLWMMVMSAQMFQFGPMSLAKMMAKRQRPCFHYDRQGNTEAHDSPGEQFVSFYSGDSSIGCCFIAVGVFLLWMYLQRCPPAAAAAAARETAISFLPLSFSLRTAVCAGLMIEPLGCILRTVCDMHWFTDMLTGGLAGSCGGVLWLLVWHSGYPSREGEGKEEKKDETAAGGNANDEIPPIL